MSSNIFYSRNILFRGLLLDMLSSHVSLGLTIGLFPFIFNFITTLSVDSSSLLVTWPNHRRLFVLIISNNEQHITMSVHIFISLSIALHTLKQHLVVYECSGRSPCTICIICCITATSVLSASSQLGLRFSVLLKRSWKLRLCCILNASILLLEQDN